MNYRGKKIAITGSDGFLGKAIVRKLEETYGPDIQIVKFKGDIRDPRTFLDIDHTYDYFFHFAAPSSQILFGRKKAYAIETTLRGFFGIAKLCAKFGIRLIYPSTGLLSQDRYNEYAMCKKICEDYARGIGADSLGIRLFATYGPGEGHKADYASVPYLFARDILNNKQPVIFGNGEQTRDFIYISDAVNGILTLAEECYEPIVDLGSGVGTSFNDVVATINKLSKVGTGPLYRRAPQGYVESTLAEPNKYFTPVVTLEEGIKAMLKFDSGFGSWS